MIVWANGALSPVDAVRIGLFDRGFTLGDAVFETVRVDAAKPWRLGDHLVRLRAAAAALGLDPPAAFDDVQALEAVARDLAHANGLGDTRAALRLTVTRGEGPRGLLSPEAPQPRAFATLTPAPRPEGPADLREVVGVQRGRGPSTAFKTGAYIDNVAARREALPADEALILTLDGVVSGAAAANLLWIDGDRLCTPDATCAIREGVARAAALAAARAVGLTPAPGRYGIDALAAAEAAALTSALISLRPVRRITFADGKVIDYRSDDPRWRDLAGAAGLS